MRRIVTLLLVVLLLVNCSIGKTEEEPSELMVNMMKYLTIGTGAFDQYDMAAKVSVTGYKPTDVVFDFELCPGNQMIRVTCGQDSMCFMVVSTSQPERILSAFITLFPYFDEIQSSLPDGYELTFRVFSGEVRSERYAITITKDGYSTIYE